jgi:hypothetical protein
MKEGSSVSLVVRSTLSISPEGPQLGDGSGSRRDGR